VLLVPQELELQELQAQQVLQVREWAQQDQLVLMELQARLVLLDLLVQLDQQAPLVLMDLQVQLGQQVLLVQMDLQVQQDLQALLDQLELLGLVVHWMPGV
jgi:hypothetical protein